MIREAKWAETVPDNAGGDGSRYWIVGKESFTQDGGKVLITRITVQDDVPGLHCSLWRVCIWADDTLVAEIPYLSAGAIGHA